MKEGKMEKNKIKTGKRAFMKLPKLFNRKKITNINEGRSVVIKLMHKYDQIKKLYEARAFPSKIYNDIYFATCFFDTMKQDLENLYKFRLNFLNSEVNLFDASFVEEREKEEQEFCKELLEKFELGIEILQKTASAQLFLLNFNENGREELLGEQLYEFDNLTKTAEEIRYSIENCVYAWRKRIDFALANSGKRVSNLVPKKYAKRAVIAKNMNNFINLAKAFSNASNDSKRIGIFEEVEVKDILYFFKDYKESGEDNAGAISKYISNLLSEKYHDQDDEDYEEYIKFDFLPENYKLESLGPFQVITIKNPGNLFKVLTSNGCFLEERCQIAYTSQSEEQYFLSTSRLTNITLDAEGKTKIGIPEEAASFCYVYPLATDEAIDEDNVFNCFDKYGGFIYFDKQGINVLHAVALATENARFVTKPDFLYFSFPIYLDPSRYDTRKVLFKACNFADIEKLESFESYAWLNPGELGFINDGCFVVKHKSGKIFYFNLLDSSSGQFFQDNKELSSKTIQKFVQLQIKNVT